jgi:DNA-directed RNA polymerase specialized sigma24 family protein
MEDEFRAFMADAEPQLRRALVAFYGGQRGREATAAALAYAWEHWERVKVMRAPIGYLFRVGQSQTRPRRWRPIAERSRIDDVWCEPGLPSALAALTKQQRVVVVLHHGYGWSLSEVAELLSLSKSTIQNHLERGMQILRARMKEPDDVRP